MKPLTAFAVATLSTSVASRAIHGPFQSASVSSLFPTLQLRDLQINKTNTSIISIAADPSTPSPDGEWNNDEPWSFERQHTPEETASTWCKAKSRGAKLIKAMSLNNQDAATSLAWPYIQSQWDGDLKTELKTWGYNDDDKGHAQADGSCDFTKDLGQAFKDLGIDSRSKGRGGPNQCFYVEHMNGPTVIRDEDGEMPYEEEQFYEADGKKYRVRTALW